MNVAVIGSNGFIGSHLTKRLSQMPGVNLFLFGRSEQSLFKNLFPYTKLDLLNQKQIIDHFSDIDVVYYLASASIPSTSWDNPSVELENNLTPFISFTECIAKLNVKKIIFVSSAGTIYGPSVEKLTEESDKQPFSPYGIIKLTIEHFLNYFKVKHYLQFDIYRVSNVYGEGQDTGKGLGIINTFIENILTTHQIHIFGDGENIRNYIHVKDTVELLSHSLVSDLSKSEIYNASSNDTISINNLVKIIKQIVEEKFEVLYENKRKSDNPTIDLDNSKILNCMPDLKFMTLEEGIKQTYQHIKENFSVKK